VKRKGNVADRFRLAYLKSTGLERSDLAEPFSFHDSREMATSFSPVAERDLSNTSSSEAILRQAKADLKNPDSKVRILAIKYYLEKTYPSIPLSVLQEILSDRDPRVRAEALQSLIKFRGSVISPLLKKYLKDSDPRVRITALRGMFQYEKKIDPNILLQCLSDESTWVRRKVATLLGWAQIDGALPILVELSRDHDPMVRRAALFSLTTVYPDESIDRLIEALTDSEEGLREWARITLEKIAASPLKRKKASLMKRDSGLEK